MPDRPQLKAVPASTKALLNDVLPQSLQMTVRKKEQQPEQPVLRYLTFEHWNAEESFWAQQALLFPALKRAKHLEYHRKSAPVTHHESPRSPFLTQN